MDEVHRVRRVARRDIISLPTFLSDVEKYRQQLRQIAIVNGLHPSCASPPAKSTVLKKVELAPPLPPVRRRQRSSAKLTVTPAPRHSIRRLHTAIPAVNAEYPATNKVETARDKLRLNGSAVHVAGFQLMSNAARQLITLKQKCERTTCDDGMKLAIKHLNFVRPQ